MQKLKLKAGDTFLLTCNYAVGGKPAPLPAAIKSQVRTQDDELLAELALDIVSADEGVFTLRFDNTQAWTDTLYCDVQFTDDAGVVFSTNTFAVQMLQDVTYD